MKKLFIILLFPFFGMSQHGEIQIQLTDSILVWKDADKLVFKQEEPLSEITYEKITMLVCKGKEGVLHQIVGYIKSTGRGFTHNLSGIHIIAKGIYYDSEMKPLPKNYTVWMYKNF